MVSFPRCDDSDSVRTRLVEDFAAHTFTVGLPGRVVRHVRRKLRRMLRKRVDDSDGIE